MKAELLRIGIRQKVLFLDVTNHSPGKETTIANETTMALAANCGRLGFGFTPAVIQALNQVSAKDKLEIFNLLKEIAGINRNWLPLVKQWDISTGESRFDHIVTYFANIFKRPGTKLACGHIIPENTFPLDRYNGCPFCGTPFEVATLDYEPNLNKARILDLWTGQDAKNYLKGLLESKVVLDATQVDDLKSLLNYFGLPQGVEIGMKETSMVVIDLLVTTNRSSQAATLFATPNDILRYLWYKHTGFLQIVEPKTIVNRLSKNAANWHASQDKSETTRINSTNDLKLKFSRPACKMYAKWLNGLEMSIEKQCEIMHPKRGIWVRVIRALRLPEYSSRKGFEKLAELLDAFYHERYEVWQGRVEYFKLKSDAERTLALLKQRPGMFARSLFSCMLWFGKEVTLSHFREVMHQVPTRLVVTLQMYAENYFDTKGYRTVKTLGGIHKSIGPNKLLELYSKKELESMQNMVRDLGIDALKYRWSQEESSGGSIYISPELDLIPISIGDRSETIQDLPGAPTGTRFPIEGESVRLFLQWGKGLKAQHLDMDLSCVVSYAGRIETCSYSRLVIAGCKHSGDIQYIPNEVGTAEYIDINLRELKTLGARYVTFTCNSYTSGAISPGLVVGWMNSKFPMKVSQNGVAFNPTDVQHQVRVQQTMTKGLVFGVLDVEVAQIIWMEMSFGGQLAQNLDVNGAQALIKKLDAKPRLGQLLRMKAEVQGLEVVSDPSEANEVFDRDWALNTAAISEYFLS